VRVPTKAAAYGIAGLALAGGIILSIGILGVFPVVSPAFNPGSSAVLSILLTDPPSVPSGVTAVYVTYSDLAVHNVAGLGDNGGWYATGAQGTLETLGLVNLSKTISTSSVPSGEYNLVSFRIASVQVTYLGRNYSASVNNDKLVVAIVGGLKLNSSSAGAALVDLQPTVLNLGDDSGPRFVVTTGAKALQVPSDDVRPETKNVGNEASLAHKSWYHEFASEHSSQLTISSLSLSKGSLSLTVSNPSSEGVKIRAVIIAPSISGQRSSENPGSLAGSAVFVVNSDGSLKPLSMNPMMEEAESIVQGAGYQLAAGSFVDFSYKGTIATMMGSGIHSGSSYQVIVVGEETLAALTVTAA
jgi:hypothetical protein